MVELIAVLAVTVLMGIIGGTAYRTYTARSQIADALLHTEWVRRRVVSAFEAHGIPPRDSSAAQIVPGSTLGIYVESFDITNGRIDFVFGPLADAAIAGRRLSLTPFETATQEVVWVCGDRVPGPGLMPLGFAGGGEQAAQVPSGIESRFLPPTCR